MSKPKQKRSEKFLKHIQDGIDGEPIYQSQIIDAAMAMLKGVLTQDARVSGPEAAWETAHNILEYAADEIQRTLVKEGISPQATHEEEGRVN